jgi:hypothetical protein
MTEPGPLVESLRFQARICAAHQSPMYGELLDRIAGDVEGGGVFAELLAGHHDDPLRSALALRLLGGLHRLALDGRAPALQRWYPSVAGHWDADVAWPYILTTAETHFGALRTALEMPPQTNEVGRSAALTGGLLHLTAKYPLTVRLFEIGASAGLNLRADHFLYNFAGGQWGPADSPVVIDDAWRGPLPPRHPIHIIERQGYDIAPIDATTGDGELTLLSYVWPDMTGRVGRLRGAIDVARRVPAAMHRSSAADAVAGIELASGALTVLCHSIMWQYLGADERSAVSRGIDALAKRANDRSPFAHLRLEPRPRPDDAPEFVVRARSWPDGADKILATCAPHGPPVNWE